MELTAIVVARAIALLEVQALDPKGQVSTPDALKSVADRYAFTKVPQDLAEFDLQKGVDLAFGKLDNINIERLTIFGTGIAVDTRSSTEDSEKVILDLLEVVRQSFGATVKPSRELFYSQVIFRSDLRLTTLHPVLIRIAQRVSGSVSRDLQQTVAFEPVSIVIHLDASQTKLNPGVFSIERRLEIPFSENSYFSQAPLRTAEHLELIQEFEAALKARE